MGFDLIYWTHVSSSYFLVGSNLENCGQFLKTPFCVQIQLDWGNVARAHVARSE